MQLTFNEPMVIFPSLYEKLINFIESIYFMNLSRINLNLLVAFDVLIEEKNVTNAGKKLFITQAAMSNVLKQLRTLFHDPLLLKVGKTMVPTRYAKSIQPAVKSWLIQANAILNPTPFDAMRSTRKFILAIDEFTDFLLLPKLYNYIEKNAPHIEICIKHILPVNEKIILESNDIDLAIFSLNYFENLQHLPYEILFREKMVCLGRKNHPLFKSTFTLKKYLSAKHIGLVPKNNNTLSLVDTVLNNLGYQRNIALRTTNIVPALYTVLNSHLIATIPESLAKEAVHLFQAEMGPCPFIIPPTTVVQTWHTFTEVDEGCQWLKNTVKQIVNER